MPAPADPLVPPVVPLEPAELVSPALPVAPPLPFLAGDSLVLQLLTPMSKLARAIAVVNRNFMILPLFPRCGMRWGSHGAQAILTLRGWDQSERFDEAWFVVAATYQRDIHVLANVVDIAPKPEKKRRQKASR